ncbi:putative pentatricopeptide repeat-containing protein At3g18840 [Telopea speciosissima]|uniref:putative pentatricopeptide repeat-containing protein At3g18840 n=1 Tax=Telopea speciosissima TaxID=54955 RepID=UPI001CC336B9|nr:putative pentatricopeptide repeat-containing protein At3g18840 [Telopea speciosissima]XP_043709344.1 putative pentatricopeptide repeat-containing protein At3g18840 [Telopea speciosissima]
MKSLKEGLIRHACIIKSGLFPPVFTSNQLIHLYSQNGLLVEARQLFDTLPERNVFTWNAIIYAYIKNQDLSEAQALFNFAPHKDSVTYNSMISGYASSNGLETAHARQLIYEMQQKGIWIDEFTLTTMLNVTANLSVPSDGEQLHAYMIKTANDLNQFAVSSLIDMYSKCGCFEEACRVFHVCSVSNLVSKNAMVAACCREGRMEMALDLFWRVPEINDIVSWNTLIAGYVRNNYGEEALKLLVHMGENGIRWSEHTFTSVLSACSSLKSLKHGKEIHAWILKNGLSSNPFISSGIVDVYSKCDNIHYAELAHAAFGEENAFSITSLIVGHSSQGNMLEARRLFDSLAEKNPVVWTALFSGYLRIRQCEPVFELLREFLEKEKHVPDALILVSVICVCAIQAALDPGKQIHAYILRMHIEIEEKLSSALIDMYAKCGQIKYAKQNFQRVPGRDQVVYNAMIAGYAHHGFENDAIQLFEEMLEKDIRPDRITFIALLSACRHAGLVEAGEKYFGSMTKCYSLSPEIDHYSCMIDLYGRANKLDKAMTFMREIPIKLDAVIWGTFLNACRINGNIALAREAEEELLRIEEDNGARYVQLANAYAAEGNWSEMGRIRRKMRGREAKKLAGCSWIYLGNKVNIFTSGDRSHQEAETIYTTLVNLSARLNEGNK